jgi:hypothetical protein
VSKNILVIGAGKFSQIFQLPNIEKLNYKLRAICDPRIKLVKQVAKFYNFEKYYTNINSALKEKYNIIFVFSSRLSSYEILKKILKLHNHKCIVFSEKPSVFNLQQSKNLRNKINKSELKFISGYMLRYDTAALHFKKLLKSKNFSKKYGEIINVKCSISNNKLYNKKYSYFRTKEKKDFYYNKNQYPRYLDNEFKANYHVFINRYSHLVNLICFFFKIKKVEKFIIKDVYNYYAIISEKYKIYANFENKKNYVIKFIIETNSHKIILSIYNPALITYSKIQIYKNKKLVSLFKKKTDVFLEEIKNLYTKKNISITNHKNLFQDFFLIDQLWRFNKKSSLNLL